MESHSFRPSKQFMLRGSIAVGVITIILVVQTSWFRALFHKAPLPAPTTKNTPVGDLVTRDSNGNGIPDWEEKLWGLDPTVLYTNGVSNKQIIEEKKKALGVSNGTSTGTNQTDALSRQLFAITTALSQSGDIDNTTLQQVAGSLGSSINIPQVTNKFYSDDIKTTTTTTASLRAYYGAMTKIVSKYNTDTADIGVVIDFIQNGDTSRLSDLEQSAVEYNQFANDMRGITVPIGVAQYHLDIMNSFAGIAQSFTYLEQIDNNSVQSLVGVAIYKGYADKLQTALNNMSDYLTRYGILSS